MFHPAIMNTCSTTDQPLVSLKKFLLLVLIHWTKDLSCPINNIVELKHFPAEKGRCRSGREPDPPGQILGSDDPGASRHRSGRGSSMRLYYINIKGQRSFTSTLDILAVKPWVFSRTTDFRIAVADRRSRIAGFEITQKTHSDIPATYGIPIARP